MIEWFDSHTRERGEPRTHGSCGEELSLHTCEVAARQCLQNLAPRFDAISEVCTMSDPFGLQRFVDAQEPVYPRVLAELRRGKKESHWMWFIFPQFAGLGYSSMTQRFAIGSREEAVAYLGHSVLGARLRECADLVNAVDGSTIREILGSPDDFKFRSSMTLFGEVSSDPVFRTAISKFYGGKPDQRTLTLLGG